MSPGHAPGRPGPDLPDGWEEVYFAHLAETCQKRASAVEAGVSLRTVHRWRNADPAFAARETEAMGGFAAMIESEITRRAIDGVVSVTIGRDGKTITTKTEYSDTLLLRLAERLETGSWRQKQQIEQTVSKAWFPTRADRKAALEKARVEAEAARLAACGGGELPR